jgi:hypothetical protein
MNVRRFGRKRLKLWILRHAYPEYVVDIVNQLDASEKFRSSRSWESITISVSIVELLVL